MCTFFLTIIINQNVKFIFDFLMQEDAIPETQVRFGKEILYLEGWCARTQYNACCRLLGPGINIHLAENQLLREIFHLGSRVIGQVGLKHKSTKLERVCLKNFF